MGSEEPGLVNSGEPTARSCLYKEGRETIREVCNLHIETILRTFEQLFKFGISILRDLKVHFDLLPATLNFVYMIRIFRRHFPKSKFKTRNKTITKKFNGRMRDGMFGEEINHLFPSRPSLIWPVSHSMPS